MACMDHWCAWPNCKWVAFDNRRDTSCPDHAGHTRHNFDEPTDDDRASDYNPMDDQDYEWEDESEQRSAD